MEAKVGITMRVAVHPVKAEIWKAVIAGKIKTGDSLRQIAKVIGEPNMSPQKVKHHLENMVTMGTLTKKDGMYQLEV